MISDSGSEFTNERPHTRYKSWKYNLHYNVWRVNITIIFKLRGVPKRDIRSTNHIQQSTGENRFPKRRSSGPRAGASVSRPTTSCQPHFTSSVEWSSAVFNHMLLYALFIRGKCSDQRLWIYVVIECDLLGYFVDYVFNIQRNVVIRVPPTE